MTAWRSRFARLYASSATSNLADGVGRVTLPLVAASCTRSPLLVSGLASFAFLPWLLFALPSGALVDRVDRRRAMAVANLVRALTAAALAAAVATHHVGIGAVYVAAFALGVAETVYDSATRAILPQVVATDGLDRANSLLTVEESLGQTFLGAPLGSALFAVAAALPLVLNAGGFALAVGLLLLLRGGFRAERPAARTSLRTDIAAGVRWLWAHRLLRSLTAVSAATAFCQTMATGVLVLYVLDVLRLPAGGYGLVLLGGGVGGLAGGLATPPLARRFGRGPVLTGGAALSAVATGAMSLTASPVAGAALFAAGGAGVMTWNVLTMSLRQALIPHHLFGRVQGAYRTAVWGAIPLGALVGGLSADAIGIRGVFAVSGGALLLLAAVLGRITHRHRDELAGGTARDGVPAPEPAAAAPDAARL